jgi:hypothetical protein
LDFCNYSGTQLARPIFRIAGDYGGAKSLGFDVFRGRIYRVVGSEKVSSRPEKEAKAVMIVWLLIYSFAVAAPDAGAFLPGDAPAERWTEAPPAQKRLGTAAAHAAFSCDWISAMVVSGERFAI